MAAQGKHNNKAYIIDNGLVVREVEVLRITRDLYTIRYIGTDTVIRVHKKAFVFYRGSSNLHLTTIRSTKKEKLLGLLFESLIIIM